MKKTYILTHLILLFAVHAKTQVWKQNADSAKIYVQLNRLTDAIEGYQKALAALKEDSLTSVTYATICNEIGKIYFSKGDYKLSEANFVEASRIWESLEGKESLSYALACNNLGNVYSVIAQYGKAQPLLSLAKTIRETKLGKDHRDYAVSCNNLGVLYWRMGELEKAEPLLLETKELQGKLLGNNHPDYAKACNNLGNLLFSIGQYNKAEPLFFEAKQTYEKAFGKENQYFAGSCSNLANLYWTLGQYEKAEPLFIEARTLLEKVTGKEHPFYAATSGSLANLYKTTGQYDKAEPLQLETKRLQEKLVGNQHPDYAKACNNLANLYYMMGEFEKALPLQLESKKLVEKIYGTLHPDYGNSCRNLGNVYRALHLTTEAEEEFRESFEVNKKTLSSVFRFTTEKEKTTFVNNKLDKYDYAFSFFLTSKKQAELPFSLSLYNRNLILSSSQYLKSQFEESHDTTLKRSFDEWIEMKTKLSRLYSTNIKDRKEDLSVLEEKATQLEKTLTRLSSAFKEQQLLQNMTVESVRNALRSNEACIEFIQFDYYDDQRLTDSSYYAAILLRKNRRPPEMIYLFEKKQMETLLSRFNHSFTISKGTLQERNEVLQSLYRLVWAPLHKHLTGITKIYFAPSGNLHTIAFAALPVGNNKVLSDKYQLVELNTTASVTDQAPSFINTSDNIQLYGGVKYDADSTALKQVVNLYATNKNNVAARSLPDDLNRGGIFNYLPGTEAEINYIEKQSEKTNNHVSILSGVNATEESFKALNGKASPSVIHIATHGFFFPDPKETKDKTLAKFETSGKVFKQSDNPLFRSGLLFAGANYAWTGKPVAGIEDGILTAYEVSNMYLPNTKLVVLSACETALGDIQGSEGVYGLQRAFKMAGVQNLVMSLWKVPDEETAEFMQEFYKNMFNKKTISDAFYHAQTTMKNKYRNEPYKWAAWVLVR